MTTETELNEEYRKPTIEVETIRSEQMVELISKRPEFIERWALLLFLFVLIVLGGVTWFIHYPDIIKAKATIIGTNAPKEIVAKMNGKLNKLFVHNGEYIKGGNTIGYIESSAGYDQVFQLKNLLEQALSDIKENNTQKIYDKFTTTFEQLGELQSGYQTFFYSYQQFLNYLQGGFYLKKKQVLIGDMTYLQNNINIIKQQKEILLKDLALTEETYKAQQSLTKEKIVSKQEDRENFSRLLNKQLSIPQINALLLTSEVQIREKEKEVTELEHEISQQKSIFLQSLQTMQSQIEDWIKKYVLIAPVDGLVTFLFPVQENQYLESGKPIGLISPTNTSYYAEIMLPQYNFGKVDSGQNIQFRFEAFPYQEFGFVSGRLIYVSTFATDSGFIGHAQLISGLLTDKKKKIYYRDGLKAEAQIITKEMRLIERLYNSITDGLRLNK